MFERDQFTELADWCRDPLSNGQVIRIRKKVVWPSVEALYASHHHGEIVWDRILTHEMYKFPEVKIENDDDESEMANEAERVDPSHIVMVLASVNIAPQVNESSPGVIYSCNINATEPKKREDGKIVRIDGRQVWTTRNFYFVEDNDRPVYSSITNYTSQPGDPSHREPTPYEKEQLKKLGDKQGFEMDRYDYLDLIQTLFLSGVHKDRLSWFVDNAQV